MPSGDEGRGIRSMARTISKEVNEFRADYIEHQLALALQDPSGRAYNRTAHLAGRRAGDYEAVGGLSRQVEGG
jgi:hypothetical protein